MITQFILDMVTKIVEGLLILIPPWGHSSDIVDALDRPAATFGGLDGWLPETVLLVCVGLILAAKLWFFLVDAVQWIYHLIPFNG